MGQKPQRTLSLLDGEKENVFIALVEQIWGASNTYEKADLQLLLRGLNVSPDFYIIRRTTMRQYMPFIINRMKQTSIFWPIVSVCQRMGQRISV